MTLSDAYLIARGRGVLPMSLSTAEARETFQRELLARSVFSARTTSMIYLAIMRTAIEDLLKTETDGGESIGQAEVRLRLKQALTALGYDPENGHFGTAADADIPPAPRGSLQDLSSDRRLNLIIDTQRLLYQSAAQNDRGLEPGAVLLFPAWELKPGQAREPRQDWPRRWAAAGGTLYESRMIAPKGDAIWAALGNGSTFPDALDTETPPFAFGSRRYWAGVSRTECLRLGIPLPPNPGLRRRRPAAAPGPQGPGKPPAEGLPAAPADTLPTPQAPVPPDMNPTVLDGTQAVVGTTPPQDGRVTFEGGGVLARAIARRRAQLASGS